jgi:hypothetical protein
VLPRFVSVVVVGLIVTVLVFLVRRLAVDLPNIASGTVPEPGEFDRRYAQHPLLAYLHITAGVVYLVGAPVQLSRRVRTRHLVLHRRMGRVVLTAGVITGAFAIVAGTVFPFGGLLEASATVLFGAYFLAALLVAFVAIRSRDPVRHRRWMIRAFAVALGVGAQRVWLGVFEALGLMSFEEDLGLMSFELGFAIAFWLGFVITVLIAEAYLARFPTPPRPPRRPVRDGGVATR